ncbi:MAG: GlcG/HbpS family heme-binding protein [Acetobacteraceae bacterium]
MISSHPVHVITAVLALAVSAAMSPVACRAEGLLTTHRLSATLAAQAVSAAVASCAKQGYAETAVVVDADGVRQAVLRGDRAGSHTLDSAYDKAYTSASFKTDTSKLVERAKTVPGFTALFTQLPHLILIGGGIVIKVGNETIGAIGAAGAPGGNLDDACARVGLDSIRDQLR